jgi:hypothetical protein
VEAVVAAVFFALAITGPLSDAALAAEFSEASAPRSAPLWFAFAWEATLMCVLLALVLIDRDLAQGSDGRYPLPLIGGTFLLALILPMLMPSSLVHVHPAGGAPVSLRAALEHAAIGALAGCGCGCLFLAAGHPQGRRGMAGLRQAALPPLVGPYLGAWPIVALVAATLLVFAAPLLLLAGRGSAWWRWPLLFWLGALAAIVCAHLRPLPFGRLVDSPLPLNMAILGTLLVALAMRRVVSRNRARRVE